MKKEKRKKKKAKNLEKNKGFIINGHKKHLGSRDLCTFKMRPIKVALTRDCVKHLF
jgi:hypothetical protein